MLQRTLCLSLLLFAACHGYFGDRTSVEDQEINSFAAARERAAQYYDGGHFDRAITQYLKALKFRPDHVSTRLGLAYSYAMTDRVHNLRRAEAEFLKLGTLKSPVQETKRVYGLAFAYRGLATHFDRRASRYAGEGRLSKAKQDEGAARGYARDSIKNYEIVLERDDRISSLKPHAYIGIAHCEIILGEDDYVRAIAAIEEYAKIASLARRFWSQRQEQLMASDAYRNEKETLAAREFSKIYDTKVLGTIQKEVAARKVLIETFYKQSLTDVEGGPLAQRKLIQIIGECVKIMNLDPTEDRMLLVRGRAYGKLEQYPNALTDLRAFRKTQDLTRKTDDLVNVQRLINEYKKKLAEQGSAG
ncbi:MAG: tetratricopeptide repeat protein [Planctomycetota bacterium]